MALTEFYYFGALPREIRLAVWRDTLPGPRVLLAEPKILRGG